ncbi:MAG: IMS domain-containing protein [Synechococcus sp.]|nr:IMS domain-containing protein [Synechococcus sp.]
MDLPIDHFRLLGVSPSADPAAILRKLQSRCDSPPDDGFTHEGLLQRQTLLRRSADLLTDSVARADYEATLLALSASHPNETVGLDVSTGNEVAGLMLLWEAGAAHEAFHLARQGLQPPQAPALGSGREADLTLLGALACRDAAREEQQQRRFESAAQMLRDGIELQQRMGKLPDQLALLEQDLVDLLPYRILDLLSRDLGEFDAHQQGITLLIQLVKDRGGLDPDTVFDAKPGSLSQADFESFFQQIRRFLTVQEQVDLFHGWHADGSLEAGCLAVLALTAAGFTRRKPEALEQARDQLRQLAPSDLDPMPLLGCLDLLLGNVAEAALHFSAIQDPELLRWLEEHPGDHLAAQCEYCRVWLERDVLPGYRDVEAAGVDLDAWFADRDVQAYVDRLDRQAARLRVGLTADQGQRTEDSLLPEWPAFDGGTPMPFDQGEGDAEDAALVPHAPSPFSRLKAIRPLPAAVAVLVLVAAAGALVLRSRSPQPVPSASTAEAPIKPPAAEPTKPELPKPQATLQPAVAPAPTPLEPLRSDVPDDAQLRALVQGWLDSKAKALAGQPSQLGVVARDRLVKRVQEEQAADAAAGQRKTVEASVTALNVVSRAPNRIELKAQVAYSDQTIDPAGKVVNTTPPATLSITYILGRDGDQWKLHEYIPGA